MSAYVLPNIILFVAIVGLLAVIARRMPEARRQLASGAGNVPAPSRQRLWLLFLGRVRGLWRFILEAKGLHDPTGARLRMKQLLVQNQRKVKARQQAVKITAQFQTRVASAGSRGQRQKAAAEASAEQQVARADHGVQTGPIASSTELHSAEPASAASEQVNSSASVAEQAPASTVTIGANAQAEASMALAKQYLDNRQFFEARKLLQSMDQTMHRSPVYWARLGYAQYHLGGYGEAVRCYERSLALDDGQPNRYYNLALAYQAAGNKAHALASLDKALKLDPHNQKYIETKQGLAG